MREASSHWYVEGNPKVMKITTQDGSFTNTQTAKPSNILLRDPVTNNAGDFTITTKIKFDAMQNFEFAGLIVYQDDENYVSLGRAFSAVNKSGLQKDVMVRQLTKITQTQ